MIDTDSRLIEASGITEGAPSPVTREPAMWPGLDSWEIAVSLWNRKRFILIFTLAGAVLGVILSLLLPARYTATAKIMTPQQTAPASALMMNQLAGSGAGSLVSAVAGSGLGLTNPNDIYIGLLSSRPVADAIIQRFALKDLYGVSNMTKCRKRLADRTLIATEKSGLVVISVTDRDPKRAAGMADAYTQELRNLTKRLAVTEAVQRRTFYDEQLKIAQEDLVEADIAFRKVQSNRGLVELDTQAKALIANLAELHVKIAAKETEVRALRSYSTERNPTVELAENELASLNATAARMQAYNPSGRSGDPGLQDLAGAGSEFLRAQHELQHRQVIFDLMLKQYDAARLDEVKEAAIIQIVEPAIEPDETSSPRRVRIVLFLVAANLLAGSLIVLVQHQKHLFGTRSLMPGKLSKGLNR